MFLLELEKEVDKQTLLRNHEVIMAVIEDIKFFAAGIIRVGKDYGVDGWRQPDGIGMFLAKETYHGVDLYLKRMCVTPPDNSYNLWQVVEMDDCVLIKTPNDITNSDFRKIMEKMRGRFKIL